MIVPFTSKEARVHRCWGKEDCTVRAKYFQLMQSMRDATSSIDSETGEVTFHRICTECERQFRVEEWSELTEEEKWARPRDWYTADGVEREEDSDQMR